MSTKKTTPNKNASLRTEWDLTLFYSSPKDPQIEKDVLAIERAYERFEKKYRTDTSYTKTDTALLKALQDHEVLFKATIGGRPSLYFAYTKELNGADNEAEARMRQLEERFTKAGNKVQFFTLALGKIPLARQEVFLKSKKLAPYHRQLSQIFETAKYDLTEAEEKILSLKNAPSRDMWVSGVDTAVNAQMVTFKKEQIPINKAINKVSSLKTPADRQALWHGITDALEKVSDFAESEMNAIITNKKINDELRGFKEPYDATILGYENDEKSVLALIDTVTKGFTISKRFYALKKKILKLPKMTYADRSTSIGSVKKTFSFADSVKIVRDAYASVDPKYAAILDSYLAHGQIDVYPKKGKGGGAFCSSSYSNPTMVLLNHVDEPRSLMTLAHEMGHAIHAERASTQPPLYQGHSISVAETASTFFEGVVFDHMIRSMDAHDRMVALHDRIQDDIATIFRQIAFFNFELALHRKVRKEGWVPKADIMKLLNEQMEAYMGPAVKMDPRDGLFFVAVGHFRNFFYVYSYAYGQLISKALLERVKKDPAYIKKVDQFLSAGSIKKPEQIFADIGIEVGPKLFADGLASLERDIDELERLAKKK